jgi:hypothetical protein
MPNKDRELMAVRSAVTPSLPKTPNHSSIIFRDQTQWDFFHLYIGMSMQDGTLPIADMMQLTPQLAQENAAVRDLCCGIGAIALSWQQLDGSDSFQRDPYRLSLQFCSRAVKTINDAKASTDSLKMAILSSLLFITYEVLHDNAEAAFTHFTHAHQMMEQFMDLKCMQSGLSFAELRLDTFETALFDMLQRLTTHPWSYGFGKSTPILDKSITACCRGKRHKYLVDDMPGYFDTVNQASKWWDVTQHFIKHHLEGRSQTGPGTDVLTSNSVVWAKCLELQMKWRSSFLPLLQRGNSRKLTDPRTHLQVMTLEILYTENIAGLHRKYDGNFNVMPSLKPHYMEMIHTTRTLAKSAELRGRETMELEYSLMRPLSFVVYKCQDPVIQKEVRSLLEEIIAATNDTGSVRALLELLNSREKQFRLRAVERGWSWYFTCSGCSSGSLDLE